MVFALCLMVFVNCRYGAQTLSQQLAATGQNYRIYPPPVEKRNMTATLAGRDRQRDDRKKRHQTLLQNLFHAHQSSAAAADSSSVVNNVDNQDECVSDAACTPRKRRRCNSTV
jgi:hypothetical protein